METRPSQPQPKQQRLEGMEYTPEAILSNFRIKRIELDPALFAGVYSSLNSDTEEAARLKGKYRKDKDEIGVLGEALAFMCLERGALSGVTARGASLNDDFKRGADIVMESKASQISDPIISSIDVTVSQQAVGSSASVSSGIEDESHPTLGFENKVNTLKKTIEYIANYPREEAVELYAWLQSGGLSQEKTEDNKKFFEDAEKMILLKYYTNPATSAEPNKPRFVLAGPKVVLSIDRSFVNKAFNSNQQEKAIKEIKTLIQVEVPYAIVAFGQYLDNLARDLVKKEQMPNLFFDMIRASCKAWELVLSEDQNKMRTERAVKECLGNEELKKQITYYQATLSRLFNLK